MVNALTTSKYYPYSFREVLGDKADERAVDEFPERVINYAEDSVKITVNALHRRGAILQADRFIRIFSSRPPKCRHLSKSVIAVHKWPNRRELVEPEELMQKTLSTRRPFPLKSNDRLRIDTGAGSDCRTAAAVRSFLA